MEEVSSLSNLRTTIRNHTELRVYRNAMDATMEIFERSKGFPPEERFSLTDQIRRSSRSVCANLAEAWRKRRYPAHFVSKLSDAEGEAAETMVWVEIAFRCGYADAERAKSQAACYDTIIAQIVTMMAQTEKWCVP